MSTVHFTFVALMVVAVYFASGSAQAQTSLPAPPDSLAAFADSLAEAPQRQAVVRGRTYVPAYSSVMTPGAGEQGLIFP